jgi:hypothetical protein
MRTLIRIEIKDNEKGNIDSFVEDLKRWVADEQDVAWDVSIGVGNDSDD